MSAPPLTRLDVDASEARAIRNAVRTADPGELGHGYVLATVAHAPALADFLSDPLVSDPIYDLPRPFTANNIRNWIETTENLRQNGEALLTIASDPDGRISRYSRFTIWPELSAAEIAGAHRPDHQNAGEGKAGAARSFGWMFDAFKVRLIGVTAALDNVRSARVIEAAGFVFMGERENLRPDGTARRSYYWEMTRETWDSQRIVAHS